MALPTQQARAATIDLLREHLARDGDLRFEVIGACMSPLIEIGDQVELRAARPERLQVGDILLFDESEQFYTHRLVSPPVAGNGTWQLNTRGDRSTVRDRPWDGRQLVGRVVAVYKPDGRRVDLTHGYWPLLNRLLGYTSRFEIGLWTQGQHVRQRIFGQRRTALGGWLRAALTAPGRLLVHFFARRS